MSVKNENTTKQNGRHNGSVRRYLGRVYTKRMGEKGKEIQSVLRPFVPPTLSFFVNLLNDGELEHGEQEYVSGTFFFV